MTPTPFETALESGTDAAVANVTTALPLLAGVGIAWIGVRYVMRFLRKV